MIKIRLFPPNNFPCSDGTKSVKSSKWYYAITTINSLRSSTEFVSGSIKGLTVAWYIAGIDDTIIIT